jgi:hypothetical protein
LRFFLSNEEIQKYGYSNEEIQKNVEASDLDLSGAKLVVVGVQSSLKRKMLPFEMSIDLTGDLEPFMILKDDIT